MRFKLIKLNNCEDCDYRRDSSGNEIEIGSTIRCFHWDTHRMTLGRVIEEKELCNDCGHEKITPKVVNGYEGAFPKWCPLFTKVDAINDLVGDVKQITDEEILDFAKKTLPSIHLQSDFEVSAYHKDGVEGLTISRRFMFLSSDQYGIILKYQDKQAEKNKGVEN